jgi:hypothetical protein
MFAAGACIGGLSLSDAAPFPTIRIRLDSGDLLLDDEAHGRASQALRLPSPKELNFTSKPYKPLKNQRNRASKTQHQVPRTHPPNRERTLTAASAT